MAKVLIYSGTTEGRMLAQQLAQAGIECDVHVATEYGQIVMPQLDRLLRILADTSVANGCVASTTAA